MQIAQVCPYDYSRPGGVKSHIDNLVQRLQHKGHEVKVIAPDINSEKISSDNANLFGKSRSLNFWGGTQIDINIALGEEIYKLQKFLSEHQFDIIHYHTIWNPLLAMQVRYYSKSKNVATFHDTPADSFMGKKVAGGVLMPIAAGILSKYLDGIISVSQSQSKYIRKFIKKDISIIPNGINLDVFDPQHAPLKEFDDGKFNLLFLGRLEPRKGIMYALEVYKRLRHKYSDIRLIISGDGDERTSAQNFVKDNHLDDVVFLGFIDEKIKANLFNTADVYVAPAIYGESFGIVLLEAMASGTAVAGFGNEGYLNVIKEPWRAYFPKPKDTDSLYAAIEKLYLNHEARESMVKWGLNEVQNYSWNVITDHIEEVYNRVIKA